jgi:hypothetical protein
MLKGALETVVSVNQNPSLEPIAKDMKRTDDELNPELELIVQIRQEINEIKHLQKWLRESLKQFKKEVHLQQLQIQQQKMLYSQQLQMQQQNNIPVKTINPRRMREIKLNRHHCISRDSRNKQLSPAFSLYAQKHSDIDSTEKKVVETKSKCSQRKRNIT